MTDISRAMVEHLCHIHRGYEQHGTVAMLTALRDALDAAEANINIKADWIDATINDMAARDATPAPSDKIAEAARVLLEWWNTIDQDDPDMDVVLEIMGIMNGSDDDDRFDAALRALAGKGE